MSNKKDEKKEAKKNKKAAKKDGKIKFSQKHPKLSLFLKLILILILLLIIVVSGVVIGLLYGPWGDDFEITKDELIISSSNSAVVDSDGNKLAELSGDTNRKIVRFDEIPDNLKDAYVAIEDERFEEHNGIDFKRTAGAIVTYVYSKAKSLVSKESDSDESSSFGGSTITQQVVKNLTGDKERDGVAGILRKVKEWAKAYQIERMISKNQILELYLNLIFVGGNRENLGVEVGAEYYFNKPVSELSLAECSFLAGINNSPNAYNPFSEGKEYGVDSEKTEDINKRCKTVLNKMLELGKINQEEYDGACKEVDEGLKFHKTEATTGAVYSYHTDATIAQVITDLMNEKGWSKEYATTYVYGGGITIHSTQNSDIQAKMDSVMADDAATYTKTSKATGAKTQSAMVVIDNATGYVVGVEGGLGKKTESRGLNRATQSTRQTGSSIKTLTSLAPGIEEGYITPATRYNDSLTNFGNDWEPKDDHAPLGLCSVREALTTSQNIPFIKIVREMGTDKSMEYLKKMGVTSLDDTNDNLLPALAIGGLTNGISPLEMAGAYATIANNGVYRTPLLYSKITDADENVVFEPKQKSERVISEAAAYVIKNLLQSVVSSGTASYCTISGQDVAAKTGTTNENKDKWLCGFTNYYTAATWYGYDKGEDVGAKNIGGNIWIAVMRKLHSGKESSSFSKPAGVVNVTVCRVSGKRATSSCSNTYSEVFMENHVPDACDAHSNTANICVDTGFLANEFCPNVERRTFSYTVEKERLKLWNTYNSSVQVAPTIVCTQHNAENTPRPEPQNSIPVIVLNGDETITLKVGDTYHEPGARATDEVDGDISSKIKISGTVNTSRAGTYHITYKVTNSVGKEAMKIRTIIVRPKPGSFGGNNTTTNSNSTPSRTKYNKYN